MRFLFVLLVVLAGTLLSYTSPAWAACLFLWHNIFRPQEFAYHEGQLPLPIFVLGVLVGSFALNFARGKLAPRWNLFLTLAVLYMAWLAASAAMSRFQESAWEGWTEIIKYLIPLFIVGMTPRNTKEVKFIAATLMLSVGIWGAQGGVKGLTSGVTSSMSIQGGQMTDNNDFMVAVDSTLPLFLYFIFYYDWKFKIPVRAVLGLMFVLSLTAVVFSNSRGATVGLGGMTLLYCILFSRHRIRDTVIIGLLVAGVWQILPQSYFDRMSTIEVGEDQTEQSAAHRVEHAKAAFACTLDYPIFGVGPYCWLEIAPEYDRFTSEPHNVWLKCSVETGIVGFIFFVTIIFTTVINAARVRRRAALYKDKDTAAFATALGMSVIGYLVPASFTSHPFSEMLWALFALTNGFSSRYFAKKAESVFKRKLRPAPDGGEAALPAQA